MNILVTGGAGYIGYDLIKKLETNAAVKKITVFDNLYRNNINFFTVGKSLHKTYFVKGDLLNKYDLEAVVKNQDIVVHLAGHVEHPFNYKDNYKYEQINQYGTVVLYELLKKHLPKKILYLSSAAVYGFKQINGINTAVEPSNYYGKSKLQAEKVLNLLQDKSEVYILRSANVFGYNPQVRLDSVINNFMYDAWLYNKINIYGDGQQQRPFIHLSELIAQIDYFLFSENAQAGTYNLGQGNRSMNELRDFLLEKTTDLEFSYINSGKELPSIYMHPFVIKPGKDLQTSLTETFNTFSKNLRIRQPLLAT